MFYLIGLGSNICTDSNMDAALRELSAIGELCLTSDRLTTKAVGDTFHADFKNQLVVLHSELLPSLLKQKLLRIESTLGREPKSPSRKTRDRTIDLDILGSAESLELCRAIEPEDSYYRVICGHWLQSVNV